MNQQQFTPRKKTILNDYRQPLPTSLEAMPGARNPVQFFWEVKNNGKIVFKVNDGVFVQGQKTTHKEVELDYAERGLVFAALRDAATNPNFVSKSIPIRKKDFVFQNGRGQMSENPITKCTFIFSKDDKGRLVWAYTKGDYKPAVVFTGPNDCCIYTKDAAGNKVEDYSALANYFTLNYVNFFEPILNRIEEENWTPPKPKNPPQGGQNNYGGNQGGNQAPAADTSFDDIDF